jgi:hypothetical protein
MTEIWKTGMSGFEVGIGGLDDSKINRYGDDQPRWSESLAIVSQAMETCRDTYI